MTDMLGPADYLLAVEQMRQDFERRLSIMLGYEVHVEIHVHSFQARDTRPMAHDACLIEHQVWRDGKCAGVRIGKEKRFHVYVRPQAVQR